jgi:hypothetical protein
MFVMKSVIILSLIIFGFMGCSSGGNDSNKLVKDPNAKTSGEDPSCLFRFNEGPLAPAALLPRQYEKTIDKNKWLPLMNVSGSETVRFAELTGVRFYKTSFFSTTDSCAYTNSLPDAPAEIRSIFDSVGKNLLGLYLPINYKNLQTVNSEAAIQVRIDSDRWTLTHEYTHHLFHSAIIDLSGVTDDQLKTSINLNLNSYDQKYKSASASADVKAFIEAAQFLNLANISIVEFLKRFSLEEMTIESMLAEKYDKSEFKLVSSDQRLNGAYYVVSSAKKARELVNSILADIDQAKASLRASIDAEAKAMTDKLNQDLNAYDSLLAQMSRLEIPARQYIQTHGLLAQKDQLAGFKALKSNKSGTCAHSAEADKFFDEIINRSFVF